MTFYASLGVQQGGSSVVGARGRLGQRPGGQRGGVAGSRGGRPQRGRGGGRRGGRNQRPAVTKDQLDAELAAYTAQVCFSDIILRGAFPMIKLQPRFYS